MDENRAIERIQAEIRDQKAKHGSWENVADEIARLNGRDDQLTIDRRALARICDDATIDKVRISFAQIKLLDRVFKQWTDEALFQHSRTLLDSIAKSDKVNFLVSTRFHEDLQTSAVSGWDLKAMTSLLGTELGRKEIGLEAVTDSKRARQSASNERVGAVIGIGSPIANPESHRLLANMLDIEPVTKKTSITDLPFFIVGRKELDDKFKSGFVRKPIDALARHVDNYQSIDDRYRSLVVGRKLYACDQTTDYAMVVAQRNPAGGHVRAVLAGLSGPGTNKLAEILGNEEEIRDLPTLPEGSAHPAILVVVFQLTIAGRMRPRSEEPKKVTSDMREVISWRKVDDALIWHTDGAWQVDDSQR